MAQVAQEELLDIRVAEASAAYKFYLNQERKILGGVSVFIFLAIWELCGNTFQLINPMFMSAPSLIVKAAWQMFASGEIWNDLYISGIEFVWGYVLSIVVAIPFGIAIGWYKKFAYVCDPFVNAMNATPPGCLTSLGYYLARYRHPVESRNHFSWRRLPAFDQYPRWRQNHDPRTFSLRRAVSALPNGRSSSLSSFPLRFRLY
jgi:hypothetical protein